MAWNDLMLGQREYVLQLLRGERLKLGERMRGAYPAGERVTDTLSGMAAKAVALDTAVDLLEAEPAR